MNDRYLYKGKDKDDGKWYEGYYLLLHDTTYCCMPSDNIAETKRLDDENTHHYIVFEQMTDWGLPNKHLRAEILPETLCQCTGLKDKYGKLIWENDIVEMYDRNTDYKWVAIVRFGNPNHEDTFGWQLEPIWKCEANTDILCWVEMEETGAFCKVIGNIFDNPELLEVGE